MAWGDYVEKELISKRFLIALALIAMLAWSIVVENETAMTLMAGIDGGVVGFYFGSKNQPAQIEVVQG